MGRIMNTQTINPIYQVKASSLVKSTYGFASTADVISTFEQKGWKVACTQIGKTKQVERDGYQKHLIRLTHPDFAEIPGLNANNKSVPHLCLLNSHDGSASLRMFYGLIRVACLNGIIAGTMLRDVKVIHNKSIIPKLNAGIEYMTDGMPQLLAQVQSLASKRFSDAALDKLVRELVDLRLANVKNILAVDYDSALRVSRHADTGQDAFTVFNVIQERLVRGGIKYTYQKDTKNELGLVISSQAVTTTTKRLSSIQSQVNINRQAYDLAVELAA